MSASFSHRSVVKMASFMWKLKTKLLKYMEKAILLFYVIIFGSAGSCTEEQHFGVNAEENQSSESITKSGETVLSGGTLLWDGSAENGTGVFKAIEKQDNDGNYGSTNGSYVEAVTDSTEGLVWKFYKAALDRRCEARGAKGVTPTIGETYYLGYRFKLTEVLTWPDLGNYFALSQWKTYGTPNLQNYPILTTINSGYFKIQHFDVDGNRIDLLKEPVSPDVWYSVVVKIKVGDTSTTGEFQVWWGNTSTPSTLLTGDTSYSCRTFDGERIDPKWGYYHETDRPGTIYFSRLKIGTGWDVVKPY